MEQISDLKRDISPALFRDLSTQLLPGESILISLPGSMGEALVVSDKRAFVIRERASALVPMCDVFAYPLGQLTGAMAIASGAGGYIELRLAEPVSDPDIARVYFPSSEEARFKAAAEYLSKPRPVAEPRASAPITASADPLGAPKCSSCGSGLNEDEVFCRHCGQQVRTICISCGDSTPVDSVFCKSCGRNLIESSTTCPKCTARTSRWMSYCPDCGSILQAVCVGCGAMIRPDWTYCAMCGRRYGSDRLDPRCGGPVTRRIQQLKEVEEANTRMEAEAPTGQPTAAQVPGQSSAEARNLLGKELCETEDYEGAIREFEAACAMDPNNAAYHCNLAVAYDGADRDAEALAEYQKTLQLAPNDLTALLYLGYMYSENDDMPKAQQVWGQILSIAPDSAEAQEVRQNLRHQGEL